MIIAIQPNELYHHGVLGMKWGIRRYQPYSTNPRKSGKKGKEVGLASRVKYKLKKTNRAIKSKWRQIDKKELAKKVAIGAAVTAGIIGTAYILKTGYNQGEITSKFYAGKRKAELLSNIPIDKLGSSDEMLAKNSNLQRIIRHPTYQKAMSEESIKDVIYVTTNKNDNRIYKTLLNARGYGTKMVTTRNLNNNVSMPSERKRVMAFMQLVNTDNDFKDALTKATALKVNKSQSRKFYDAFQSVLGNTNDQDVVKMRSIYFDKLTKMGYSAVLDDNDAGYLGNSPVILFNAKKDTTITGMRAVKLMESIVDTMLIDTDKI